MTDAFYLPDGDAYLATEHTRGPWTPGHQHGGPPSALIAHVVQGMAPELTLARITVDFLRPVPIGPVVIRVEPLRAGAKVQRYAATLAHGDTTVVRASLTLVRPTGVDVPTPGDHEPLPPPDRCTPFHFPFFRELLGYNTAMETRLARGTFGHGRVAMWMRQRVALIAGAPVSPVERVLVAADTGSGVSAAIGHASHSAINFDLTVALHRTLEGEWVGLDSISTYEPAGIGLADTWVVDGRGPVGRVLQGLVIERRSAERLRQ